MEEELMISLDESIGEKTQEKCLKQDFFLQKDSLSINLDEGTGFTEISISCPNLGPSVQNDAAVQIKCETEDQAVRSLDHDFAPWLNGIQLHKYYDNRTLTEEQMRAMVKATNDKALAVPAKVREEFLASGLINRECPSHAEMMAIAAKIHPDVESTPEVELFERMRKKLKPTDKRQYGKKIPKDKRPKNDFKFTKGYLYHDDVCTYIPVRTIEACWNGLVRLVGRRQAIKSLAKQILERMSQSEL
jgi:hypothetical protein